VSIENELLAMLIGSVSLSCKAMVLVAEFSLLVVGEFLLSSSEDDTRSWGNFLVFLLLKCHANLRGWGYIFIGC